MAALRKPAKNLEFSLFLANIEHLVVGAFLFFILKYLILLYFMFI
jgi:hypothetical protein